MIPETSGGGVHGAPQVRLSGVGAAFGEAWLFRAVDLAVSPGEWFTVMGPSGSGKTTLLRFIAGLLEPSEGEATIGGRAWPSLRGRERLAMRRRIGLVQQQTGLLHATILENVALPLRWRGMTQDDAARVALESLSAVGMSDSASRNALSLSGGERQRVGFARAIAQKPDILLLDEFTNHQDPARGDVLESIVADHLRRGASAVVVAHDLAQMERISRNTAHRPTLGILIAGCWRAVAWDRLSNLADQDDAVGSFLRRLTDPEAFVADSPNA